jgi:hypothetical protein
METIRAINKIVVVVPIGLIGLGIINAGFAFAGIMFTAITGFTQVVLALVMFNKEAYREKILYYLVAVVVYFAVLFFFFDSIPIPVNYLFGAGAPFLLAIFLSNIIHKKIES